MNDRAGTAAAALMPADRAAGKLSTDIFFAADGRGVAVGRGMRFVMLPALASQGGETRKMKGRDAAKRELDARRAAGTEEEDGVRGI